MSDTEEKLRPEGVTMANDPVRYLQMNLAGEATTWWLIDTILSKSESEAVEERVRREQNQFEKCSPGKRYRPPHAVSIYSEVKSVSIDVATIDLAYWRKILSPQERDLLFDRLRLLPPNTEGSNRSYQSAELIVDFRGELITWHENEFNFRFQTAPGNYFKELVNAAARGFSIGQDNFPLNTQSKQVSNWKYRLKETAGFPIDLWERIVVQHGRHRLCLEKEAIGLLPDNTRSRNSN